MVWVRSPRSDLRRGVHLRCGSVRAGDAACRQRHHIRPGTGKPGRRNDAQGDRLGVPGSGRAALASLSGPMPPDMYVTNTTRRGEYDYTDQWEVDANGIWITTSSGGGSDTGPVAGMQNFVFVRIENRLGQAGANVKVRSTWPRAAKPAVPEARVWKVLPPFGTALALQNQATRARSSFRPVLRDPGASGQYKLLAVVEADGDPSNVNPARACPAPTRRRRSRTSSRSTTTSACARWRCPKLPFRARVRDDIPKSCAPGPAAGAPAGPYATMGRQPPSRSPA